jgi:hypothetical protein
MKVTKNKTSKTIFRKVFIKMTLEKKLDVPDATRVKSIRVVVTT